MLTAIVVGVATLALGLALVARIHEAYGTIEEDEIFEEREAKLNEEVCKKAKFSSVDELFLSGETYEVK